MCIIHFKCCSALSLCCRAAAYLAISVSALDLPFCMCCWFFFCVRAQQRNVVKEDRIDCECEK